LSAFYPSEVVPAAIKSTWQNNKSRLEGHYRFRPGNYATGLKNGFSHFVLLKLEYKCKDYYYSNMA
jgi:hypothetical protein